MIEKRKTKSKFLRVRCKCNNEQIIFGKASSITKCLICGKVLSEPGGGKINIKAKILEVLG